MRTFSRLFALAPDCHATGNRYAHVWQRHFYDGLRGAGCQVVFPRDVDFTWARPAQSAPTAPSAERGATSQKLREQIRGSGCDAVVSYCFASDIDPGLVRDTVAMGLPWVNFFCDSTYAFDRVEPLAREASLNWFPEGAAEPRYRALGRPLLCRPYAVNPDALPEAVCQTAVHGVGFVGAPTGNRVLRLAALALWGCSPAVRGAGWHAPPDGSVPRSKPRVAAWADRRARGALIERILVRALRPALRGSGPLDDAELTCFVSQCRVVLGLNEGRDLRGTYRSYLKLRDIEFPGYGSCYLVQYNDDLPRALEIGREALTFRRMSEAAALVKRCAREVAWAQAIGRAGRRRVLAEHTWATRLGEIAQAI
jgi:hypothetical protein